MNIAVLFVLIGLAVGLLASVLREAGRFGFLGDVTVGGIGALLAGFLFLFINAEGEGLLGSMASATLGAVLLIIDLRLLRRSFVEQHAHGVIWRRGLSPLPCGPLLPNPSGGDSRICRVCGQRHLS